VSGGERRGVPLHVGRGPLRAAGTIEERILALHSSKRELADSILAETDRAASISSSELRALLGP